MEKKELKLYEAPIVEVVKFETSVPLLLVTSDGDDGPIEEF